MTARGRRLISAAMNTPRLSFRLNAAIVSTVILAAVVFVMWDFTEPQNGGNGTPVAPGTSSRVDGQVAHGYRWVAGEFAAFDFQLTAQLTGDQGQPAAFGGAASDFHFSGTYNLRVLRADATHVELAALLTPVVVKVGGDPNAELAALISKNVCLIDLSPDGAVIQTRFSRDLSEGECELIRGLYDWSFVIRPGEHHWSVDESTHTGRFQSAYSVSGEAVQKVRSTNSAQGEDAENVMLKRSSWTGTVGRVWLAQLDVSEEGTEKFGDRVVGDSVFRASFRERAGVAVPHLLAALTDADAATFVTDPSNNVPNSSVVDRYANQPLNDFFAPLKDAVESKRGHSEAAPRIIELSRWIKFNGTEGATAVGGLLRTEENVFVTADLAAALAMSESQAAQDSLMAIVRDRQAATDEAILQAVDALGSMKRWNPEVIAALQAAATNGDSPELAYKARLSLGDYVASQPDLQPTFISQVNGWVADNSADIRENAWRSLANSRSDTLRDAAEAAYAGEKNVEVKAALLDYLGNLKATKTSDALLSVAVNDPDKDIAMSAIEALGRGERGGADATVIRALETQAHSASPQRAEKARSSLNAIRLRQAGHQTISAETQNTSRQQNK